MDVVSGLPAMLPSQMSDMLDAEAAASDLFAPDGGAVSLSEALSPQEQVELASLRSAESDVGMLTPGGSSSALTSPAAYLDLSVAAQEQLMQSGLNATPPALDPANPDFYA